MTTPLVLSGRPSTATETWIDVNRRAAAIDERGDAAERGTLASARDLTSRLLRMADVLERLSTRAPTPRDPRAMRRRRWIVGTRRPDETVIVSDLLESDGTGSVRRIELRDPERPAAMSTRCRPIAGMIPIDCDERIGPALREAAHLIRSSLASLADPERPDPLVVPSEFQDAAAAVVMGLGDVDPRDDRDAPGGVARFHARSPWSEAFIHDAFHRRSVPAPRDAGLLPVAYAASVRFERPKGEDDPRRAAHMLVEPCVLALPRDVKDPIARLRLLSALETLRGAKPRRAR